jgi:hypothetical protein
MSDTMKSGNRLFTTSEDAWSFMRECDAKGWPVGFPLRVYPQCIAGAHYRVTFVVR